MPVSRKHRYDPLCPVCAVPWCNGDHSTDVQKPLAARIASVQSEGFRQEVVGSKGGKYTVGWTEADGWTCTCRGYEFSKGQGCRHISQVIKELANAGK